MKLRPLFFLTFLLILLLGACRKGEGTPTDAAEAYVQAILSNDGDFLDTHTCRTVPEGTSTQSFLDLWSVGLALRQVGWTADDVQAELSYEVLEESPNLVQVAVRGTVIIPVNLPPSEFLELPAGSVIIFDEIWRIFNEDNTWKWCGTSQQ